MAYDYDDFIDAMRFGLTMSDRDTTDDIWKMVDEVVNKAKAFDEIKKLRNDHYIYSKTNSGTPIKVIDAKPFGREVSHLINKKGYMEDK
ncbi:hypothetical protein [Mammaliicoccus sciuri]|uniref:hypothetical protein n=1 Tax=Mammaliicoccus sciuri TaxID=1296 RepID=UPI000E68E163|nr:hypothetical protein [Mammaliicoccus sciuri]RIN79450.1 hypothetical protein BU007_09145 [Mammaliicoccus sciuri]